MKSQHVLLNEKTYLLLKKQGYNISKLCREYTDKIAHISAGDSRGIDLAILKKDLEELNNSIAGSTISRDRILNEITAIETKRSSQEKEQLIKEKEYINKQSTCYICECFNTPKWHKFPKGNICNGCFLNLSPEQLSKLTNKEEKK